MLRADHLSRGVLQTAVCLCLWSGILKHEKPWPASDQFHRKKEYIHCTNQSLRSVNYTQIKITALYNNLSLLCSLEFSVSTSVIFQKVI
jgi:hypothetical protein